MGTVGARFCFSKGCEKRVCIVWDSRCSFVKHPTYASIARLAFALWNNTDGTLTFRSWLLPKSIRLFTLEPERRVLEFLCYSSSRLRAEVNVSFGVWFYCCCRPVARLSRELAVYLRPVFLWSILSLEYFINAGYEVSLDTATKAVRPSKKCFVRGRLQDQFRHHVSHSGDRRFNLTTWCDPRNGFMSSYAVT